jgi:hypothetical protein
MRRLMLAVVALTLLFVAPPAEAWTVTDVIRDCSKNGKLSHPYPPSLIRKAREQLPADIDEYTDCRDLLATPTSSGSGGSDNSGGGGGSDQSGAGGGGSGAGGSGGGSGATTSATPAAPPAPPSPAELKQLDAARQGDGGEPVSVGGSPVTPGTAGMTTGAVSNGLPSTLLIVLILLAVLVAVAGGPLLRGRFESGTGSPFQRVFTRRRS